MREEIPAVTRDQMREVDRIMIEDLGIELIQMMENAGRNLARLVFDRYQPKSVLVLAGSGGNGGGGLVAARHLSNWGVSVSVATTGSSLAPVPAHQAEILRRMGVNFGEPASADVVIDAIIGYSLVGAPRGVAAHLIDYANQQSSPVVSLDAPSGVDVDTGDALDRAVGATVTMTLAAPKVGLVGAVAVGEHLLADISVPPQVYQRLGLAMPVDTFAAGPLVSL